MYEAIPGLVMGAYDLYRGIRGASDAKKLRSQYDQYERTIPEQDPGTVSLLGETRRRRRAYDAGTDPMTSYIQGQILNTGAQTQNNVVRNGRNSVSDLLRVQAGTNNALAASGANASRNSAALFGMEGNLVNAMGDRLYNRQLSHANRIWSEYARAKEDSGRQIQSGLGAILTGLPTATGGVKAGAGGGGGLNWINPSGAATNPNNSMYDGDLPNYDPTSYG